MNISGNDGESILQVVVEFSHRQLSKNEKKLDGEIFLKYEQLVAILTPIMIVKGHSVKVPVLVVGSKLVRKKTRPIISIETCYLSAQGLDTYSRFIENESLKCVGYLVI